MDDYREASKQGWSAVAGDWAELSEQIDRQLRPAADWMMETLALQPGERVLELAGGPGTMSLLAARAVGPTGRVTHSDFSESMVEVARKRLGNAADAATDAAIECRVIDAESIDLPDGSVDAVVCRMGFMLMADPGTALRETARVLGAGGRVALAVWTNPAANPWVAVPMQVIATELGAPPPPPDAPGMWSLGTEAILHDKLSAAGLRDARIDTLDATVRFDSADHFLDGTKRLAGPLRALFAAIDAGRRESIEQQIRDGIARFAQGDGSVVMPEQMLVAIAHR